MIKIIFAHPNQRFTDLYHQKMSDHFDVEKAYDGLEAYRKILSGHPQLVIAEYDLPKISGITLLRFVRFNPTFSGLPFIFLSSSNNFEQALNLGANDWVNPSYTSPDLVIKKVYYHLKNRIYV